MQQPGGHSGQFLLFPQDSANVFIKILEFVTAETLWGNFSRDILYSNFIFE
jgi:hypothetical protein